MFVALVVSAVVAVEPIAEAGVGIERYDDEGRPPETTAILEKFERFTMKYGMAVTGASSWKHIHRLPAVQDENLTPRDITDRFDQGHKNLHRFDTAGAKREIARGLAYAQDNVGTAILISSLPELLTRAYVTLAIIATDANDKKTALSWMIKLKTDIPDHPAIGAKFGEDVEKLYNEALKVERGLAHGHLTVRVTEPRARIFVNEIERGAAGSFEGDLPEGEYRIFVTLDGTGFRFDRTIIGGRPSEVHVDWDFHTSFVASRTWIGLRIPARLKSRETEFLNEISSWISGTTYSVLRVQRLGDQRYLSARVYMNQVGYRRAGKILLGDPQEDARMEAFAAFLEDGSVSPLIEMSNPNVDDTQPELATMATSTPPAHADNGSLSTGGSLAVMLVGAGLTTVGGVIVVGATQNDQINCVVRCSLKFGIPMSAAGVGAFIAGFVWLLRSDNRNQIDHPQSRPNYLQSRSLFVVPTRDGAMAGILGSF